MKTTFALLLLGFAAGCGSTHATTTTEGALNVALSFDGGEAILGDNTVSVVVTHEDGSPMDAEVSVHLHMPAHGHADTTAIGVTRIATGKYSLSPVRFNMPGEWKIHVKCKCPMGMGETEQTVTVR